jgi:hypothetical protein
VESNAQAWNRYSYVGNDPLAFTDPNGFSWLSSFFHSVGKFFTSVGNFIKQNFLSILQITLNVVLNAVTAGACVACVAAISAAIVTGISGGNLGQVLKAAAIAAVTTLAFGGTDALAKNPLAYIGANAAVGCASSVASGGSCGSGAASAAVGATLSPVTGQLFPNAKTDIGQYMGATLTRATIGGVVSVAGGGKFANGALTGAYQYLATNRFEGSAEQRFRNANGAVVVAAPIIGAALVSDFLFGTSAVAAAYGIWKTWNIFNNESSSPSVQDNQKQGKDYEDEIAADLEDSGRQVDRQVRKDTPFGPRIIDLEVRDADGNVLGGVEVKSGNSRYRPDQRSKDEWLGRNGYPVNVVRQR